MPPQCSQSWTWSAPSSVSPLWHVPAFRVTPNLVASPWGSTIGTSGGHHEAVERPLAAADLFWEGWQPCVSGCVLQTGSARPGTTRRCPLRRRRCWWRCPICWPRPSSSRPSRTGWSTLKPTLVSPLPLYLCVQRLFPIVHLRDSMMRGLRTAWPCLGSQPGVSGPGCSLPGPQPGKRCLCKPVRRGC